ncbi:MAG TPA: DUF2264 domain-containing protein [Bacteroidota bacterium]|nr:DUF2264 domain-containing protein [Bacteroidota bacterium]
MKKAFEVRNPDFKRSPFTGMTKKHYVECATFLLEKAFTHIDSIDSPISFPIVPGKTYPQPNAPDWRYRSAEFEALERTFTLAGPLIHNDPEVTIKGIKLREYYSKHIYNAFTPGHPNSIPLPETLPDSTYQFTCEFGGLFKTLLLMPDTIWDSYTQQQKDEMAVCISKWAHHRTTQNNWRIFNIVTLSFLKKYGYEIDDELLKSHLLWVTSYHSGNGWYLEQTYNYYTISLFIVYLTIWNRAFGDKYYPEIAKTIERSAKELMKTYTNFFARDGSINMWARSICYRTWISGGFPVSFMLKGTSPLDPGWARRLCSGSLLQFVTREEFFDNEIPSLGFYGHREFVLQNYSCAGSPFLMFLPFICLALPDDSPFWTAKENDGMWKELGKKSAVTVLDKPGLVLVNHGKTGTSEIIPGKVYYNDQNYSKLCYSTHFPWEDHDPQGGTAMEYSFRSLDPRDVRGDDINFYLTGKTVTNSAEKNQIYTTSESMLYNGVRKNVIYRQAIMRKPPNNGVGYIIDLAEIIIPGGVIRIDRSRMAFEHELTLGHFGLPHPKNQKAVLKRFEDKKKKGITASIPGRKLALIAYHGWDSIDARVHSGRNAEAEESTVLFAYKKRTAKNPAMELMITVMLHKMDDSEWTEKELSPIKKIEIMDITPTWSALGVNITLSNNERYQIDFNEIDGHRSC